MTRSLPGMIGTRERIRALPFIESAFREEAGVASLSGEAGYSTLERLWTRPTCDVNGVVSGYTGQGAKTVLPATAMAKVSCRLVPDQDPSSIGELLRAHVERVAPPEVETEVVQLSGGRPWRADLLGFALPGANMHAPNEWFPDAHVEKGIETLVSYYDELGRIL